MVNSVMHEVSYAHKYKTNQKIQPFSGSDKPIAIFPAHYVKMPTVVGVLTFMRGKHFMLTGLSMISFITSGQVFRLFSLI